ncbi:hypothetical protein TWF506_011086 [Arthrobotrys conoides]|uniref:Uncharacterized protein n=1 Tax=Arthrobotrys conoides TaxID=74498 RepID=A0AAN8NDW6_9PEZI
MTSYHSKSLIQRTQGKTSQPTSKMEIQLPFPFKLLVIRKEGAEWMLAHVSTFDCAESPHMPKFGATDFEAKDSIFQLSAYPTACLVFIQATLSKINSASELEGTGCKYCIYGADTAKFDDAWDKVCIVLKLANCNDSFKAVVGEPECLRMNEEDKEVARMLERAGLGTPATSTSSARERMM